MEIKVNKIFKTNDGTLMKIVIIDNTNKSSDKRKVYAVTNHYDENSTRYWFDLKLNCFDESGNLINDKSFKEWVDELNKDQHYEIGKKIINFLQLKENDNGRVETLRGFRSYESISKTIIRIVETVKGNNNDNTNNKLL